MPLVSNTPYLTGPAAGKRLLRWVPLMAEKCFLLSGSQGHFFCIYSKKNCKTYTGIEEKSKYELGHGMVI